MTTTIMLVDDQELLRMGFRLVLDSQPDLEVVAEAGDGREAIALSSRHAPDIILMDVRMPEVDGVTATREIIESGSASRVIILTTFDLDEYVYAALRAGASGFLLKDAPPADLLSAIRAVASGDAVVAPSTTRRLLETFAPQLPDPDGDPAHDDRAAVSLTPREREVVVAVAHGLSNAEIARELVLADATVKTHIGRILAKTGLRDRVALVVLGYETGLVRPNH
jgi:DNA-binding NarL/FixJ family response regulator